MRDPTKEYESLKALLNQVVSLRNDIKVSIQKLQDNLTADQWVEKDLLESLQHKIHCLHDSEADLLTNLNSNHAPVDQTIEKTRLQLEDWHKNDLQKYLEEEVSGVLNQIIHIVCVTENAEITNELTSLQKEAEAIQKNLQQFQKYEERLDDFKSLLGWIKTDKALDLEEGKLCQKKFGFSLTFAVLNHLLQIRDSVTSPQDSIPLRDHVDPGDSSLTVKEEPVKESDTSYEVIDVPACEIYDGSLTTESETVKSKMLVSFGKFKNEYMKHIGPKNYFIMAQQLVSKMIDRLVVEVKPPKVFFDDKNGQDDFVNTAANLYAMGIIQKITYKGIEGYKLNPTLYPLARTDAFKKFMCYRLAPNVSPTLRANGPLDTWIARSLLKEEFVCTMAEIFPSSKLANRTKEEFSSGVYRYYAKTSDNKPYKGIIIVPLFDKEHFAQDRMMIDNVLAENRRTTTNYFFVISTEEEKNFWEEKCKAYHIQDMHFFYVGKGLTAEDKESLFKSETTDLTQVVSSETFNSILKTWQAKLPNED